MGGSEVQQLSNFKVDVAQLRELMDTRGMDSVHKLEQKFGGINGLCSALYTSPSEGKFFELRNVFKNCAKYLNMMITI